MLYKDFDGKIVEIDSSQDKLLRFMYKHFAGRLILKILTIPAVSKIAGLFLDSKVSCMLITPFIKANDIKLSQYERCHYKSYNDFFKRKIKCSKRKIDMDDSHLISPSDGNVTVYPIRRSTHFMVKNTMYTLRTILRDKKLASKYYNGYCVIIRLCVDNYHRYCYIDNGYKSDNIFIPGRLHTVNPIANDYYPIYKENSREYSVLYTDNFGEIIQMEVGALMVGRINNFHRAGFIQKGQEKGCFEFGGSTIMLFIPQNSNVEIRKDLIENSILGIETKVHMGECIAKRV